MRKKTIVLAAGVLVAAYLAATPYITVFRVKSAARSHDAAALSGQIDFPSVRQSLKDQMNAQLLKGAMDDGKADGFEALGAALAGAMIDRMVDAYVTPSAIGQLMSGTRPSVDGDVSTALTTPAPLANASMSYESFNRFRISVKMDDGRETSLVLRRRGIGWKITEILIPFGE